ncbi:hypothetical protein GMA3_82 [Gordonia phage GMA3]|uniref:Uncharacterized protein n=1 Tax=Gordonia phage GMA3 TaxID=1647284 RepID=A0A0K0NKZ4_9CAUD|nr:hypothetical protein AU105_gp082 [Gordonia phage GMA3]AKL88259.1 hypothetical protein GMA3_82 [Gordonia phage GMA3]
MNSRQLEEALEWLHNNEDLTLEWHEGIIDTEDVIDYFEAQIEEAKRTEVVPDIQTVIHMVKDDADIELKWTVDEVMEINSSGVNGIADTLSNFFTLTVFRCFCRAVSANPEYFADTGTEESLAIMSFMTDQLIASTASNDCNLAERIANRFMLDAEQVRAHALICYNYYRQMESANG